MNTQIEELELQSFEADDSHETPPSDIVAYNELRSCADLHRMFVQKSLIIQPEFQREIAWKPAAQTRFIDSLIKQLPIPSMCFSLDYKTQKWQVIDGLQRIWSIIRFLSGESWNLSRLDDVDPKISGQNVSLFADPNSPLHELYTRVQNLTLPITVLRCDYSKKSHTNYLFTIFHRLNTGAIKLNNQEIRNCIYSGALNQLLKDLNKNKHWVKVNRMKKDLGYRFTKEEVILRCFAFHSDRTKYKGQLAKFLNEYMETNREPTASEIAEMRSLFERTIEIIANGVFRGKTPERMSVTLLECLMYGVMSNLEALETIAPAKLQPLFETLKNHEELSELKLSEGLAKIPRVNARLIAAKEVFANA
jgi:uncharacterized protein with ParB-like and HNH nuclease domain